MNFITIKTFDNPIEANIMKSKLLNEGIQCFLFDEHIVEMNPLYNITVGGIKLKIAPSDKEKATEIIQAYHQAEITNEEGEVVECPSCQSKEFHKGFKSFKSLRGILSAIFSLAFMVYPIFYKTVNKCKQCGTEF